MKKTAPEICDDLAKATDLLKGHDSQSHIVRVILRAMWYLVATASQIINRIHEQNKTLNLILKGLNMPLNTTTYDQNFKDATTAVANLAASHNTTSTEGQAFVDKAAGDMGTLRDAANAAIPPATTVAGAGGSDTTGGAAAPDGTQAPAAQ